MARNVAASFSFSTAFSPKKYDVFLSFRGEDTRDNFSSHLYTALCQKQILTYTDEKLSKGDEILASLRQAIQDSYISIVVFSKNYASSTWCLDELNKILHCKKVQGQLVIPVFYEVKPSDVRNQTGTYMQAFKKHEQDLKHNQDEVRKWRAALTEAANLAGWDSSNFLRNEYELIQNIVKDILQKLDHRCLPIELNGLLGVDNNCTPIELLLLSEVQTIGIWGMGGIGKTTPIAGALFVKYSSQYEGCCFLANIRKNSRKHGNGLHDLRCKLLAKLLEDESFYVGTSTIEPNFVERRLSRKKVFIVLDDVTTVEQLEYLVGEFHCFGSGSKIIITTREKHVLRRMIGVICEVKKLKFQESLKLFSLSAFNQSLPLKGYEELSKRAIVYARRIPLVLKVLGSSLHSKNKNEWNSTLRKLKKYTYPSQGMVSNLCSMHLSRGLEWFLYKIRYLERCGYQKLVEHSMPYSHVKKPWDGVQDFVNLEETHHTQAPQLMKLPNFSKALNLKRAYLGDCKSLHHVDSFISSLRLLVELIPNGYSKSNSLQNEVHLKSLIYLNMKECLNLKDLWYNPFNCGKTLKRIIEGRRRDEQFVAANLNVLIKFSIETDKLSSIGMKECGVYPIYVLEYYYLVPKMEFRSNLNINSKRPGDVDEQEPLPQCKKQGLKSSHDVDELFGSNWDTDSKRPWNVDEQEPLPLHSWFKRSITEHTQIAMIGAAYGFELAKMAKDYINSPRKRFLHYSLICLPRSIPEWFGYRTTQSLQIIHLLPNSHLLAHVFFFVLPLERRVS